MPWSFVCSKMSLTNLIFWPAMYLPLQILTGQDKQEVGGPFLIFWQLLWIQFCNLNLIVLLGASY